MTKFFANILRTRSLKSVITVYVLAFSLISLLIFTKISDVFMSDIIMDKYMASYTKSVYSCFEHTLSDTLTQISMSALNITTWQHLYNIILDDSLESGTKAEIINEDMDEFLRNHNLIAAADIITNNGELYRSTKGGLILPEKIDSDFIGLITRDGMTVNKHPIHANNNYYIAIGNRFTNFYNNYDVGYLVLYINENELYSIYQKSLLQDSSFFIICDNYILSHSDKSLIGSQVYLPKELYDESTAITRYSKSIVGKYKLQKPNLVSDLSIVTILSADSLYAVAAKMKQQIYCIFGISLVLALITAVVFTQKLLNQYTAFKKNIVKFSADPGTKISFSSTNELHELEESFNSMVITINNLIEENTAAHEHQREAEIKALQLHINPHFIYNALDTITCMAKLSGQKDIEQASYSLASFFRIGLSGGQRLISIRNELEHVKSYLRIQQMRFPDKFDVDFSIPEDIMECKILKLTLQPLVENSILHGFKGIKYKGKISICASKDYNSRTITLTVADNGVGFTKNPLTAFLHENPNNGYGLYNVQQRLKLEYGNDYGLSYEINETGGTTAIVKIICTDC